MLLALLAATPSPRTPPPRALFNLFSSSSQPNPADAYAPDPAARPVGLPSSFEALHAAAIEGVLAAVAADVPICEVDYPPIASVNARGDGSAKSEARVAAANGDFVGKLKKALRQSAANVVIVGCGGTSRAVLGGDAVSLRDGKVATAGCDVAIVVAPADIEQWESAACLSADHVVIVNGVTRPGPEPRTAAVLSSLPFSLCPFSCLRFEPHGGEAAQQRASSSCILL